MESQSVILDELLINSKEALCAEPTCVHTGTASEVGNQRPTYIMLNLTSCHPVAWRTLFPRGNCNWIPYWRMQQALPQSAPGNHSYHAQMRDTMLCNAFKAHTKASVGSIQGIDLFITGKSLGSGEEAEELCQRWRRGSHPQQDQ